jgi:molybdate transport system ATP-binding protein
MSSPDTLEVNFTLVRGATTLNFEFACRPGISVISGASGSGKTSLFDCVSGLLSPTSGTIKFGEKIFYDFEKHVDMSPQDRRVGYVLQRPSLFPHMTVRQNIEYAFRKGTGNAIMVQRVDELSKELGINNLLDRKPDQISGGQAQRVSLVRAIAAEPLLFLFDEPLSSLDEQSRAEMVAAIKKVKTVTAKTILYVTHSFLEAEELADYRIVGSNREFRAVEPNN